MDYTPDTIAWLKSDVNPAFEAANPGVTVEITEGSWSGWDTTFSGFFAAGEGPDIINLGSEMNTLYGESLADMDPFLAEAAWADIKILALLLKTPSMMANCAACRSSPHPATFSAAPT